MNKEEQYKKYARVLTMEIFDFVPAGSKVLDVGCNTGNLGEKLIKEKGCTVYGIDYAERAIMEAKDRLGVAKVFDLESYELPFENEKFDVIIFADILEHLKCPEIILEKYSAMLNEKGRVIASIPNIANVNVRIKLLFGKWDYRDTGVLDKTHMRFFTKKTILKIFQEAGLTISKINSTPGFNFIFLRYFSFLKKLKRPFCKIYPKLFAQQFIIVAQKIK